MITRRAFAASLAPLALTGCASRGAPYAEAVGEIWRLPPAESGRPPVRALVHAAVLAANGHNTQPWRFSARGATIVIAPDFSRRTPAVDPDDHHLFASLGCAAETLLQAAPGYGWTGEARFLGAREGVAIDLAPGPTDAGPLFDAIPRRASTRTEYAGRPVEAPLLKGLEASVGDAVEATLIVDRPRLDELTEFIVEANTAQVADPAFVRELKGWIRFDEAEALARRDGLFAGATGAPTLPRWLGGRLFDLAFTAEGEKDKILRQMRSSAGAAVFVAASNDPAGWVEAGRAFTRFALTATAAGLKLAFLNQPVEHAAGRTALARWLGAADRRPDLVVRFGYGPDLPRSLRRRVDLVLDA